MPLKAYEEFADEPLAFPIGGKVYTVPPIGMRDGIRLQRAISGQDDSLKDAPPEELWKLVMGDVWQQMLDDDVPVEAAGRAGAAALTDFQFGREAAEKVWEHGLSPEWMAALGSASQSGEDSQGSSSTGEASATRSRASSSGTTSRKKSGSGRRKSASST